MHAEGERRNQSDPRAEGTYLIRGSLAPCDLLHKGVYCSEHFCITQFYKYTKTQADRNQKPGQVASLTLHIGVGKRGTVKHI